MTATPTWRWRTRAPTRSRSGSAPAPAASEPGWTSRLGSAHNLYAALPCTTAAYLTLCNGRLTADECYRQAIVNKVVPRQKLIATCEEMAEMICDSSPLAVQAAVRLYRLTAAFPPSLVSYASHLDQEIAESEDGAEGPRAFREKRKPVWKMR